MVTNRRVIDTEGPDFYPTPIWATHALLENEIFDGEIWECACGDGAMSEVIKKYTNDVYSSDLIERDYGDGNIDFLQSTRKTNNIITNPPFKIAEEFLHQGLKLADKKVALLLRLAFLESIKRYNTIYNIRPPAIVYVFTERVTFYPKGATKAGSGTTAYAWFVWDKNNPLIDTRLKWLPPGYKAKYK